MKTATSQNAPKEGIALTERRGVVKGYVTIDNIEVPIENEKNLLALIRKAGIELPTFCYHSSLSVYGACRLCVADINGRIEATCSTPPRDGMALRTNTKELRDMRRMTLELLLANHDRECTSCERSGSCKLQELANKMGIDEPRFRRTREFKEKDTASETIVRDPNKCVLCGDCVRYCDEIQGVGAIDFAYRGEEAIVTPAYGKSMADVDCISCGQCAAVCPTGALILKKETPKVWKALDDPQTKTAVQIAPAVRVAMGELFGGDPGEATTGKITTALRMLGFDRIYDTVFGADMTVVEEAEEFLARKKNGKKLPLFTSCCPAWVKYAEEFHPAILGNLSSCMSPQGMLGSAVKEIARRDNEEVKMIAVMPCAAKKFEKTRSQLTTADGAPIVDHVITTRELGMMIDEAGIRFDEIVPSAMDQPMGLGSGAGTIFGNAGGVSEAVLRYTAEKLRSEDPNLKVVVEESSPKEGVIEKKITLGAMEISLCAVQGLRNAGEIAREAAAGNSPYDIIEVMACPGGCVGGAGQPINLDRQSREKRKDGLNRIDSVQMLKSSSQNPFIRELYDKLFDGRPGTHKAHELLHTTFRSRRRINHEKQFTLTEDGEGRIPVRVCVGTSCFNRGSQKLLHDILEKTKDGIWKERVVVEASFCKEECARGPTVTVGDKVMTGATIDAVAGVVEAEF